jgi:ATP-dependent Clp protease adaptor protein ClpS
VSDSNLVIEKKKSTSKKIKPPSKYNVVIFNDNVTTVEFVIALLIAVFDRDQETAIQITQKVHENGSGVAGNYAYEIAEQKCFEGVDLSRNNGFPLVLKIVEE